MTFTQRAHWQLRFHRAGAWLVFAGLGGIALGALAWADQRPWIAPTLCGVFCAGLFGVLRYPIGSPAEAIDPGNDEDGLQRAALAVGIGHPLSNELNSRAIQRPLRFRPLEELRPLGLVSLACVALALWVSNAPPVVPLGDSATLSSALFDSGTTPNFRDEVATSESTTPDVPPITETDPAVVGAGTDGESSGSRLDINLQPETRAKLGSDFGLPATLIDRYWKLRAQESR